MRPCNGTLEVSVCLGNSVDAGEDGRGLSAAIENEDQRYASYLIALEKAWICGGEYVDEMDALRALHVKDGVKARRAFGRMLNRLEGGNPPAKPVQ